VSSKRPAIRASFASHCSYAGSNQITVLLAPIALWIPVLYLFAGQWAGYAEYRYGWAVPFLCGYLVWCRAKTRPLKEFPVHRRSVSFATGVLALLLLPLYIVQEASPIWRAASWGLAGCLVGISAGLFYLVGGQAWLRHFAAPVLFFLVAVPWPTALETAVVDHLTRLNTNLSVEALVLLGLPVVQHGNVMELTNAVVGIDEACSGIRSTQANLMLALFFGELARVSVVRRLALAGFGFLFALVFNFGRTLLLTLIASKHGVETMNRWHDPAGVMVLLGCFAALAAASAMLGRKSKDAIHRSDAEAAEKRKKSQKRRTREALSAEGLTLKSRALQQSRFLRPLLVGLASWGAMIPIASAMWFRAHEQATDVEAIWKVPWPPAQFASMEPAPISEEARGLLRFDEGGSVRWRERDGIRWQMFYFRWWPAESIFRRVQVQFAKNHRPERCLPASGRVLKEEKLVPLKVAGLVAPFRFYSFDDGGKPLHIYLSVRDAGMPLSSLANMRSDSSERILAAWNGNRAAGQQTLQFAVWGIEDIAESLSRMELALARFIVP
jgi:exosortase